jgi:hypothetical protein
VNRVLVGVVGLLLGSLVPACYAPSFSDCALRCSGAGTCPDGMSCDGQFCRAAGAVGTACMATGIDAPDDTMFDGPVGDRDGDTITDARDNCPNMPNVDQDNEDGDVFGDVCDPCPVGAGVANMDSDGDKVGDGCDPNPNVPGESIALFEGFNRTPTGVMTSGSVMFVSGQLVIVGEGPTMNTVAGVLWPAMSSQNTVIVTNFKVDELLATAGAVARSGIGVVDRFFMQDRSGIWCGIGLGTDGKQERFIDEAPVLPLTAEPDFKVGIPRTLAFRTSANNYDCIYGPAGDRLVAQSSRNAGLAPLGHGIRSNGASAHVDWFMVINTP